MAVDSVFMHPPFWHPLLEILTPEEETHTLSQNIKDPLVTDYQVM
jgi:hypothetical protein